MDRIAGGRMLRPRTRAVGPPAREAAGGHGRSALDSARLAGTMISG